MWCKVWDSLTLLTQWMRRRSSMKATPWLFIVHQSTVDLRPSGTSLSTHQHFTFVQVSATATATAFIRTFTAEWVVLGTLNVAPWPVAGCCHLANLVGDLLWKFADNSCNWFPAVLQETPATRCWLSLQWLQQCSFLLNYKVDWCQMEHFLLVRSSVHSSVTKIFW